MNRRTFIRSTGLALVAAGLPIKSRSATSLSELRISRVLVQEARGRRLTPVAPNAYAAYRGYDVSEPILRIQTRQGMEGISRSTGSPETLKQLLGLDPFKLFIWDGDRSEPLIDVEQADMNAHGYLRLRAKAATQARLGMTLAPHNFGSKMGLYAQVHLGLVTPNWEIAELDDSEFPALEAEGIVVAKGVAKLTGQPGLGVRLKESALEKPSLELKA